MSGKNRPLEYDECLVLTKWLRRHKIVHVHIPNEGRRSKVTGARLRAIGLHSGFPDYLILTPPPRDPRFRGVALEMKRRGKDKPSVKQAAWLALLGGLDWLTMVGHGADEAIAELKSVGYGPGPS
jgi:hypothetical protein